MTNYSTNREEERKHEINKFFATTGHVVSCIISFLGAIALMLTFKIVFLISSIVLMLFSIFYQYGTAIQGETPLGKNPLTSFLLALFAFVPAIKKDILYLRWLATGKDHPLLKK